MIINNERGNFSKKYTDDRIAAVIASLEEKFGDLDNVSIAEQLDTKADSANITATDKVSVVTYNEQGIVTGGKELSSDGSLIINNGVIGHTKWTDGLTNTSFGYGNYVPTIKVDEFGHIVSIENRLSYSITEAPQAGQVLRGDALTRSYMPEDVDNTVIPGSYHLVTGDAVYKAIASSTSTMYRIMGSCTTEELEAKVPTVGDVWNVTDGEFAGANYVWVGQIGTEGEEGFVAAHWDKLSETMDLSVFADKIEVEEHLGTIAGKDQWGHVKTSDEVPLADSGEGSAGTDNGMVARADHVHPLVTGAVAKDVILPASGGAVFNAIQALEDTLFTDDGKIALDILPEGIGEDSEGKGVWGQITGILDDQTDLTEKFGTKQNKILKGGLTIAADGWTEEGDMMVQTVDVMNGEFTLAFGADSSVFLNWDPTDFEPYDLGIHAVEVLPGKVRFEYPAVSGAPSKDFVLSAVVIPE